MAERNGNWMKIGAWGAVAALILTILSIFAFTGGVIDGRIDKKILETDKVHQSNIAEIKTDVAVIKERQNQIKQDISEQKDLAQKNFEELKELIRNQ
jgi:predicted glycosyltransferase